MNLKFAVTLGMCWALSGCVTPPSAYVSHQFQTIRAEQLAPSQYPLRLQVVTRRFRGDQLYDDISPWVYAGAVEALRASRVVQPSPEGEDGKVLVIVREASPTTGDTASAMAQGALTGLTLGAIGTTVKGDFDISLEIIQKHKTVSHEPVRVSVHVRMGSAAAPAGVPSYRDANDALKQALGDAIQRMLWGLQQDGRLPAR